MATYEKHIQNLRSDARISARRAIDYMDGHQLGHLMDYLDGPGGIKKWKERGVLPLNENIVGMIIDRSSQTYQEQPAREVIGNTSATTRYSDIISASNLITTLEDADMVSRLLKTAIVLVQEDDNGDIYGTVLSQHNCDVYYNRVTREFESLLYTGGGVGAYGGQLYYHWTPGTISELELMPGAIGLTTRRQYPNSYGFIPAAILNDIRPPRSGFWAKPVWEQLVNFNLGVNMFHTETKFNQRYGSMGALFTNTKFKEGTVTGPDTTNYIDTSNPDVPAFVEYRSPTVQIDQFVKWLDMFRENIGQEWGVNIKTGGEGAADSGFKLIVEELPGLQLRKKRHKPAVDFEQDLYDIIAKIKGLPDADLNVVFDDPDLPVNEKEKWEVAAGEMGMGVLSKEQYLKEKYPAWTQDQIDAELEAAKGETLGQVPDFGGI